jgi:hypothetical protein
MYKMWKNKEGKSMKIKEITVNWDVPNLTVNGTPIVSSGNLNIQYKAELEDKDCPEEVTREIIERIKKSL